jgi:hypothetical protein
MKDHPKCCNTFFAKVVAWADDGYKESRATFWKKILCINESILWIKTKDVPM